MNTRILLLFTLSISAMQLSAQAHKDPFAAACDTTAKWKRMPHVNLSLLGGGYASLNRPMTSEALLDVSGERLGGRLLEACWRYKEGLCFGLEVGHLHQRIADFAVDHTEFEGYSTVQYGDFIGIDQRLGSIGAFLAGYVAPFPRKHGVGFDLRLSGGLRYSRVTEQYRFLLDDSRVLDYSGDPWLIWPTNGFADDDEISGDYEDFQGEWERMSTAGTVSRGVLSATMGLRVELFLSKHFSLFLPDLQVNITIIKAKLPGASVPDADDVDGMETIAAHTVDLTGAALSSGLAIHF